MGWHAQVNLGQGVKLPFKLDFVKLLNFICNSLGCIILKNVNRLTKALFLLGGKTAHFLQKLGNRAVFAKVSNTDIFNFLCGRNLAKIIVKLTSQLINLLVHFKPPYIIKIILFIHRIV